MTPHDTPYLAMALNNAWANATLYGAVTKLDAAGFTAPRPGFFPSLCQTLNHILLVDRYYLAALEGDPETYADVHRPDITDPASMAKAQSEDDMRFARFCRGVEPATLADSRTTLRDSGPVEETVGALLLHLVQHQVHHRGQAHVQLQEAGIAPPQLDDFYLAYGRVPSAQAYFD